MEINFSYALVIDELHCYAQISSIAEFLQSGYMYPTSHVESYRGVVLQITDLN